MAQASISTSDTRVESVGGLRIFVRLWRPTGKVRGVITLVPGFNAHSGYYAWAAEQLADRGLAVYALDLRGRGHSDGERFYVEKFADYVSDVAAVVSHAKEREPGLPMFLLGHSAGGVVACIYTLEHSGERLKKEFPLITLPVLILHGTADKATKPSGSQRFFDMAGSKDKTLKLYQGHFHDLLNDVGKEQVMADIENWIDTHLSAVIETKARTQ